MRRVFLSLLFILLMLPFFMALVVSLGAGDKVAFPPEALSLRWYEELLTTPRWLAAISKSMIIAASAALISVSLALPICYQLWKRPGWYARGLFGLSLSPFLLPPVILAIGAAVLWTLIQVSLNAWLGPGKFVAYGKMYTTFISHGVLLLPLATVIIARGFAGLSPELLEASRTLGANARQQLTSVILPLILPFIATGFVLVFIVSLNEYLIAFQVSGIAVETLPIRIFNEATRGGHSPILTAGAVLFASFTVISLIILSFFTDLLRLFGSNS